MSSKECRIIQERAPHCQVHEFTESPGLAQPPWCAYKMRWVSVDKIGPSCYADRTLRGGLTADPGTTSSQPRRSRSAPPSPGGGARSAVPQRPPLLPRPGQGPGQVRDAARAPGRRRARGQGGQRPRLLASGLLPRRRGLRGGGHEKPARREAWTPRSAQGHARDPRVRTLRSATLWGHPLQRGGRAVRRRAASPHTGAPAEDVMRFWPAVDPAQLDYERLREMALAGTLLAGPQAERFQRGGLMVLIRKPTSSAPSLTAALVGVPRPRWSPHVDPRLEALADAYALLTAVVPASLTLEELAT